MTQLTQARLCWWPERTRPSYFMMGVGLSLSSSRGVPVAWLGAPTVGDRRSLEAEFPPVGQGHLQL